MGMIKIFTAEATDFSSNGDVVIQPVKAKVHKEDNGDFYLDIEAPLDYQSYFVGGNIIVAPTPQGPQAFRLSQVTKTRKKITAKAWHIWYDSKNIIVYYKYNVWKKRQEWMGVLDDSGVAIPSCPFTDLDSTDSTQNQIHLEGFRGSMYDFFQVLLSGFGGHIVRDNYGCYIKDSIGQDKGVTVEYGKNLKDITKVEDWTDVCTVVMPVGKDGLMLSSDPPIRASSLQYDISYSKVVTFDQSKYEGSFPRTDLQLQADAYLEAHKLPKVSYSLKASLDVSSDIGDTVYVRDTVLGADLLTTIRSYDYDCLTDRYTEVNFGNFTPTAKGMALTLNEIVQRTNLGLIGENKQLQFNNDNTVTWANTAPV